MDGLGHVRVRLDDAEAERVVPEHERGHAHVAHVGREYLRVDDVRHHAQAHGERDHVQRHAEHGQRAGGRAVFRPLRVKAPANGDQRHRGGRVRQHQEELAAGPFHREHRQHGADHLHHAHEHRAHDRRQCAAALLEYLHRVHQYDVDSAQLRARLEHRADQQRFDRALLQVVAPLGRR